MGDHSQVGLRASTFRGKMRAQAFLLAFAICIVIFAAGANGQKQGLKKNVRSNNKNIGQRKVMNPQKRQLVEGNSKKKKGSSRKMVNSQVGNSKRKASNAKTSE